MTGSEVAKVLRVAFPAALLCCLAGRMFGQAEVDDPEERVIHYYTSSGLADPVARLQKRLDDGKIRLRFEPGRGYLRSLLKELRVPVSSQGLVFSKTSSQADHTSPQTPRAVYFSDDVHVGWAPKSPVIDLIAVDPALGPIFYTLDQVAEKRPKFTRRSDCLKCHFVPRTLNVPGLVVRSFHTAANGTPIAQVETFVNGHNSPLESRWGGWYVTGTHVGATHLGNIFMTEPDHSGRINLLAGANVTNLRGRFDTGQYLSRHSDLVSLLVLEHEVRMQNLITRANYETLHALDPQATGGGNSDWPRHRITIAGEMLLEYLLFRNEAPLKGPVKGTSNFAVEFQGRGPHDSGGRSFRQLDLKTRLLRYPCSFLIYSESFDALPQAMKNYLWGRLGEILSGQDRSETYATMKARDRQAVLEILRETKPEFAAAELRSKGHQAQTTSTLSSP